MAEEKRELLKDLLELRKENIKGIRGHMYQMLLLSGAIAAFLMPVYASDIISEIQKIIVPISMACFLLAIVVGTLYLSRVLRDENRWLADMQLAIENGDKEAYDRYLTRSKASGKKRKIGGFYSLLVDTLFGAGCLLLVTALILK